MSFPPKDPYDILRMQIREWYGFDSLEIWSDRSTRTEKMIATVRGRSESTDEPSFQLHFTTLTDVFDRMASRLAERFKPLTVIVDRDPGDEDNGAAL